MSGAAMAAAGWPCRTKEQEARLLAVTIRAGDLPRGRRQRAAPARLDATRPPRHVRPVLAAILSGLDARRAGKGAGA